MSKHTPGPWVASRGGFLCQIAINSESDTLAVVYGENGENKANASLIAAAPDLLEAIEDLMEAVKDHYEAGGYEWKQARAAIAKAKGEQA